MTREEQDDDIARLEDLCDYYELQWRRATDGARTANKAVRRLQGQMMTLKSALSEARLDARCEGGLVARLTHENQELKKKVQRLSLRILDLWSKE